MAPARPPSSPARSQGLGILGVAGVGAATVGLIHLGNVLTPTGEQLPLNPIVLVLNMATGASSWPAAATILLLVAVTLLVIITAWLFLSARSGARPGTTRYANAQLASSSRAKALGEKARRKEMATLHPGQDRMEVGLQIGRSLDSSRRWMYQGWRQCAVHVWGPGRGKTTSQVIRHARFAPGPYLMTSNKVDGVKEVLALRRERGKTWIFDPQRIYRRDTKPAFIFNPLSLVTNTVMAVEVAGIFEASTTTEGAKEDAQFGSQGRDFLAWCMLAAAKENKALSTVYVWVASANFEEPQALLKKHGEVGPAAALFGMERQPDKTRGSVAAAAQRMASPMVHGELMQWTQPTPGLPVFNTDTFAASHDTLILLSKKTAGSAAALISSLVKAVFTAAEAAADANGGRLAIPMVADLDEVGNVVKLREIPEWYTYFGSKGLVLSSYFQNASQGIALFGKEGWNALWEAASIRVYGGGAASPEWLKDLSELIGYHDQLITGRTHGAGGQSSVNVQTQRRHIMDTSALYNLEENRAVLMTANAVTTIVETVPFFKDRELNKIVTNNLETPR